MKLPFRFPVLALAAAALVAPAGASALPEARPERPAFFSAFPGLAAWGECPDHPVEAGFGFPGLGFARPRSALAAVVRIAPATDSLAWADAWAVRRDAPETRRPHSALSTLDPPGVPVPRVVAFRSGWRPFALEAARR